MRSLVGHLDRAISSSRQSPSARAACCSAAASSTWSLSCEAMKARSGGSTQRHRAPGAIPDERDHCPAVLYFEAEFVERRDCPLDCDSENHEVRFHCQREADHLGDHEETRLNC